MARTARTDLPPLTPEQQALATTNGSLAYWYARRLARRWPMLDREDLESCCRIALCRTAATYDSKKGSYSTAMFFAVRTEVETMLRSLQPTGHKSPLRWGTTPRRRGLPLDLADTRRPRRPSGPRRPRSCTPHSPRFPRVCRSSCGRCTSRERPATPRRRGSAGPGPRSTMTSGPDCGPCTSCSAQRAAPGQRDPGPEQHHYPRAT